MMREKKPRYLENPDGYRPFYGILSERALLILAFLALSALITGLAFIAGGGFE